MPGASSQPLIGRRWLLRGQVQGVGFRPFVYRSAVERGLTGWVRNAPDGVRVEAWGTAEALGSFHRTIVHHTPQLAIVEEADTIDLEPGGPVPSSFEIADSDHANSPPGRVTVDSAVCGDCVREMREPTDRSHRHALINCTNCGPRYTIIRDLPYDRAATTMAGFAMCPACAAEYADPRNRRFHAQPVCCPACGPRVVLRDPEGGLIGGDPFARAAEVLRRGGVLAIKGLGGFHLAVDAVNGAAVAGLRDRKRRDSKPFAVMVRDLAAAARLVRLSGGGVGALTGPAAPIVVAIAREGAALAPSVAPGLHRLGVMLPSTPVHHLLFDEGLGPLVMTSANAADAPLVTEEAVLRRDLAGVFDAVLTHDRPIERAVDDSVVLDGSLGVCPIRRARGYAPAPVQVPVAFRSPGLCMGADLKNSIAIAREREVIVSQHIGDLSNTLAFARARTTADDLQRLFGVRPGWIACDTHPGYLSGRLARDLGRGLGVPVRTVQHHHAHLASLLAEHGRVDRVIGVICDGVGHGEDGTAWGGEILVGDLARSERVGRTRPLRLPGGDLAAVEIGRCAAAWLWDLEGPVAFDRPAMRRLVPDAGARDAVHAQLSHGLFCPPSSGVGRLFDASAALLGVCDRNHHEAMSGQLLEAGAWAERGGPAPSGLVGLDTRGPLLELDHRPLLRALLDGLSGGQQVARLAWVFHAALAEGLATAAGVIADRTGVRTVGLSGGVFCNDLLLARTAGLLADAGFEVLTHRNVPPNDGGIGLGQAVAVGATLAARDC